MARIFLSNANAFLPSFPSTPSSYSSSTAVTSFYVQKKNVSCKALSLDSSVSPSVCSKRNICISLSAAFLFSLAGGGCFDANAAILEADDNDELMEKVKKDRKKRLEKQGVINSSSKETEYLQDLVYKLNRVGQAIEKNDLSAASSVLGQSPDTEWVQKVKSAFNKLSSTPEEKMEVGTFNSSLDALISSVTRNDIEASTTAFLASANALEKWTTLTGLVEQLRGL